MATYSRNPRVAYTQGVTEATHNSYRVREFLDEAIVNVSPLEIPFTKLIGFGEAVENMKVEWQQDANLPLTSTLASDLSAVPTSATVTNQVLTVASGTGAYFQKGHLLRIRRVVSNAEQFVYAWVYDDPSGDTVPVKMNITKMTSSDTGWPVSTVIASADATHRVDIVGVALNDGVDSPAISTSSPSQLYNYVQIFDAAFQVGHAQQSMKQYGKRNDFDYVKSAALANKAVELEVAALRGLRAAPDTTNNFPALMGGLQNYVTSNVTSMSGSAVTELKINDTIQAIYDAVGSKNMPKLTMLANSASKRQISRLFSHSSGNNYEIEMRRSERKAGVVVNTIDTEFGEVDVLLHKWCPTDRIYFLCLDYIKLHPLKDSAWYYEDLPADGPYRKGHVYGAYTMIVEAPECHGVLTNVSTTVS